MGTGILKEIDKFYVLPHSIALVGEWGLDQNEVCEYIAEKFDLRYFDISDIFSKELINEINLSTIRTLYVIDTSKITINDQNSLLKLYEEPGQFAYFVLICESEESILDTLKTRSYILKLNIYEQSELEKFIKNDSDKEIILKLCSTPGQIEVANRTDIKGLFNLCDSILNMANIYSVFNISSKVNFSDEYDKYDYRLLFKCLLLKVRSIELIEKILYYKKYINSMNNKRAYFENFLLTISKFKYN